MLYDFFKRPLLSYAGTIAAIGGFFGFVYVVIQILTAPEWLEKNSNLLLIHGAYLYVLLIVFWLVLSWKPKEFLSSPRIITVREDHIVICEEAPWLGIRVAVAVYCLDGQFEELVALGEVINIQTNGLVQIRLEPTEPNEIQKIQAKTSDLLIKPGIRL